MDLKPLMLNAFTRLATQAFQDTGIPLLRLAAADQHGTARFGAFRQHDHGLLVFLAGEPAINGRRKQPASRFV
jgi:hypothetical protein